MNDAEVTLGGERIVIDEVGVGGGIVDRLKEQDYRVHGYNGGRSPKRPTFANLRAESYWHLPTLLEHGATRRGGALGVGLDPPPVTASRC